MDYNNEWDFEHTLPRVLRDAGYHTCLSGKLNSQPAGNRIGFERTAYNTGDHTAIEAGFGDYADWLDRQTNGTKEERGHGQGYNSTDGRPWHLDEHLHPTNWTTQRAIDFLDQRDPTRPFFLTVSFVRPHTPFDPPQAYWDQYIDRDLPAPVMGEWTEDSIYGGGPIAPEYRHRARAGYYGSVTHVDHQLSRLWGEIPSAVRDNLIVVMTADHGEMLGDHGRFTKMCPFEGAARVPLILSAPHEYDQSGVSQIDRPVGLEDVMPTILDAADLPVPVTVEGRSLLDLVADPDREDWRTRYHGEFGPHYSESQACQYLVDETTKYIWNPVTGEELLFDLEADPLEETNLAADPAAEEDLTAWRSALVDHLADRPEGFVADGSLQTAEPAAWRSLYSEDELPP